MDKPLSRAKAETECTPKQEAAKVNNKTLVPRYQNRQALRTKIPERRQVEVLVALLPTPKRPPHRAPVLHFSTPNRQMLEMLTSCKGSEICPKLIMKKLQQSTRDATTAFYNKQRWEALITIHETNDIS